MVLQLNQKAAQSRPSSHPPSPPPASPVTHPASGALTTVKQLARRGGPWDVIGPEFYMMSDSEDEEDLELSFLLSSALSPRAKSYPQSQGGTPLPHNDHAAVQYPAGLAGLAGPASFLLQAAVTPCRAGQAELPTEEQIASMSYEDLLRFAGGYEKDFLEELD